MLCGGHFNEISLQSCNSGLHDISLPLPYAVPTTFIFYGTAYGTPPISTIPCLGAWNDWRLGTSLNSILLDSVLAPTE